MAVKARGFGLAKDALVIRSVYGWLETRDLNEPNGSIGLLEFSAPKEIRLIGHSVPKTTWKR